MLKSLFPQVNWESVEIVGFDMDGTLYDEFDFIVQVYKPISGRLAQSCLGNSKAIYSWMLCRWLEKGSSYNHIFEEVLEKYNYKNSNRNVILECLDLYRNFQPKLVLSERVKILLSTLHKKYSLFLITDGSCALQTAKFQALGLQRWFQPENFAISGCFGSQYYKPSTLIIDKIAVLNSGVKPQKVVFFGDRDIDREFSCNSGFQFASVKSLL